MRVNLMRNIDYWIGTPICFFLSIFYKLEKAIVSKKLPEQILPKKIIFLEFSEIGSAVLGYPAMKMTKQRYPQAKLYFWIFKRNEEGVHMLDIISKENVITTREENFWTLFIDTIRNLWWIWHEKIDVMIDMELFSRFTGILGYLTGAKIRVGFYRFTLEGLYRGNLHTHKVMYNPYMHISKNFIALIESIRFSEDRPLVKVPLNGYRLNLPKIKPSQESQQRLWSKLKQEDKRINEKNKIVILNVEGSQPLPLRRWRLENYINLARKLLENSKIFIVVIGTRFQKFLPEDKCSINLMGKTTIRELIDLFNISDLLISHDSGAIHLASLTEINIIALFGPETPLLYGPLTSKKKILYSNFACSPCISAYNHRKSVCENNKCLKAITPQQVYNVVKEL